MDKCVPFSSTMKRYLGLYFYVTQTLQMLQLVPLSTVACHAFFDHFFDNLCNNCRSFAYSFRSTRETLDTVLFTLRKFVFTGTLIHECSQCSIP